jgi:hypothetical protein
MAQIKMVVLRKLRADRACREFGINSGPQLPDVWLRQKWSLSL